VMRSVFTDQTQSVLQRKSRGLSVYALPILNREFEDMFARN